MKLVVEVHARQLNLALEQALLKSRLKCPVLFGLQIGIRLNQRRVGNKQFFKARFFDTGRIGKAEPCSRENLAALCCLQRERHARYSFVCEPGAGHDLAGCSTMNVPHAGNRREPLPSQTLLCKRLMIQPKTRDVLSERKGRSSKREELAILVLELVADGRLRPTARRVVALIQESGTIEMRRGQKRTIKWRSETFAT